jgi:hypothetical protein
MKSVTHKSRTRSNTQATVAVLLSKPVTRYIRHIIQNYYSTAAVKLNVTFVET